MNDNIAVLIHDYNALDLNYLINEPMSRHTTFKIGGAADVFLTPRTTEEFISAVSLARECDVPYYIIGRGSNILFADEGYRGVVISCELLRDIRNQDNILICGCGASLNSVAIAARDKGLAGLSFAYGIPGLIGGASFMNAGAYGGQLSDVLIKSTYYDTKTCAVGVTIGEHHHFGYRQSIYREHHERIILSAEFNLSHGDTEEIRVEMDNYMDRRRSKQPLEYPSAGSVFKRYPGHFTGQLIEECGLKGYSVGGAQVSEKHAGFIINRGGASAADVLSLIDFIKNEVYKKFGIEIECEMIYVK